MKNLILILICGGIPFCSFGQEDKNASYLEKVKTLDSTIETLYAVISGDAGQERDWDLMRFLFTEDAKLIPVGKSDEGVVRARYMSPDDYIETSGEWLVKNGFFEKEVHRVVENYGNIAHLFSTYESFRSSTDETPFMRGINSIQVLNDGNRWWIVNIYWLGESKEFPLPNKYLKH